MDGRIDFEKYGAAISRGLNLVCLPQGGVTFRPATRFIKETKVSDQPAALMSFAAVGDQAYMVETGNFYFRFYRNQGQIAALTTTTVVGGWADRSTGTATGIGSGSGAVLTGAGDGFAWAENTLSAAAPYRNQVHVVTFHLTGNPGSLVTVQVGTASTLSDITVQRNMGMGSHTLGFNFNGNAALYLQFINENSDIITVSGITVQNNVPIEVASPYPASVVAALRWAQSGDVKYIFHDNYPVYKLERRGDTSWSLVRAFFSDGPYLGINPDTDLAKSNLIKNGTFNGGLVSWLPATTGTGFVNYNTVNSNALFFQFSSAAAGTGQISQSVATDAINKVHTIHFQIVGGGTVAFGVGTAANNGSYAGGMTSLAAGWYTYGFTPTATPFFVTFNTGAGEPAIVGGVAGAYCYNTSARLLQPSGMTGSITVTALGDFKPFVATDVGRSIRFQYPGREPGWGVITAFGTHQSVTVLLYRDLTSTAPLESWRLGAWSDTTGWPHTGTFYQQRLFVARTVNQPQTIWASQSGDFQNNRPDSWVAGAPSIQDTNALNFTLASGVAAPIVWLTGARRLIAGTAIGQWYISSKGSALTPSDFSADPQSSVKARDVPPVEIDSGVLFIQRAKRAIYDLGYDFRIDALKASDVTILSDHIGKGNFVQIVYQGEPISTVWGRLEDGTLVSMTYKRDQNVVGLTPIALAGTKAGASFVESTAVIAGNNDPGQVYNSINRDEVWMIVNRIIGGTVKRYVEMMEGYFDGPNRATYLNKSEWRAAMKTAQADAFHVDCGLTYSGASTSTISGLSHLEGEVVKVVADGAVQSDKTVTSGSITLDLPASKVHVGLSYGWIYRGMKLPYGSQTGPGLGQTKTINSLVFVLRDSASFDYAIDLAGDGDEEETELKFSSVPFRKPGDLMSAAYPLFSGEVAVDPPDGSGFNTDPRVVMMGTAPMPWTLLGIQPRITETEL